MFKCVQCVVLILIVFFCSLISGQKEAGDLCTTSRGTSGICKLLTDCPPALAEVSRGRFPVDRCGFDGLQAIICCVGEAANKPNTPFRRPATPRSPTRAPLPLTSSLRHPTPIPRSSGPTPFPSTFSPRPSRASRKHTSQTADTSRGQVGDVAARMCKLYAEHAYVNIKNPGLSLFSTGFIKDLVCPIEKEELIVGGKIASPQEFPHMAQIGYITGSETNWGCGGSLISEKFVLTVGHCLWDIALDVPKLIRVGMTNLTDLKHVQTRNVKSLHTHPGYTIYKYNDIGLIEVESNFDMNTFVRPACIFTRKDIPVQNAIASGWGPTAWGGDGSNDLRKVVLELYSNSDCNMTYRSSIIRPGSTMPDGIVDDLMICAGSRTKHRDACTGDSGGPLQIYHPETPDIKCMYEIIGVTAFGQFCGSNVNVPGVYTRVSAYTKWIEDKVWPQQ